MIFISKNLKFLRKKQKMAQGELARLLDIKPNTVSNYENGVSTPDYSILEKITSIFHVSAHDILYTDIEMTPPIEISKNLINKKESLITHISNATISRDTPQYISENIISIPIVDVAAAAGFGYSNPDYTETLGELSFPANLLKRRTGNYYCGRVDGDSMVPTLLYGDFIIFRLLSPAEWGDVKDDDIYFVVNRSGHAFVKRIKNRLKQEGFIVCQSDNPDKINKEFQISNDDISNIYHVEWRFSNDMTNINQLYFSRLDTLEDQMRNIQKIIKKSKE